MILVLLSKFIGMKKSIQLILKLLKIYKYQIDGFA